MFSKNQRIAVIIILFLSGFLLIYHKRWLDGALILLGSLLLIYGHFRYGTVWRAYQSIKRNEYAKAKKELSQIRKPELLAHSQRGYYYWSMGLIKMVESEFDISERYIRMAINLGVRTENDRALLKLTLSEIYLKRGQPEEAKKYLDEAKNIPHKPGLDEYIQKFEDSLYKET